MYQSVYFIIRTTCTCMCIYIYQRYYIHLFLFSLFLYRYTQKRVNTNSRLDRSIACTCTCVRKFVTLLITLRTRVFSILNIKRFKWTIPTSDLTTSNCVNCTENVCRLSYRSIGRSQTFLYTFCRTNCSAQSSSFSTVRFYVCTNVSVLFKLWLCTLRYFQVIYYLRLCVVYTVYFLDTDIFITQLHEKKNCQRDVLSFSNNYFSLSPTGVIITLFALCGKLSAWSACIRTYSMYSATYIHKYMQNFVETISRF